LNCTFSTPEEPFCLYCYRHCKCECFWRFPIGQSWRGPCVQARVCYCFGW
jgi:hypothetical protein